MSSPARHSKERVQKRRGTIYKSVREMSRDDVKAYVVICRANVFYVYNSENSQDWLPGEADYVSLSFLFVAKLKY